MTGLVDQYGQPLRRELLTREVGGPTIGGVRSPIAGYPADGMTPVRLAQIMRSADQGEPLEYFELAELIEERDLHYAGVLATRKRSASQITPSVEAASDDPEDVRRADIVREWLKRDELAEETFDILDATGKGVGFTEIIWDSSQGQWEPARLEWRDQRHFTFDRQTMRRPMLRGGLDGNSIAEPLPPFKFIYTQIKAKSGLPIRSGVARLAMWAWMFKAFTQRDWAIFVQTYGQPVRIGKFHEGATKDDKATLFRAVANIAGDCAAIIPQSMQIDFVEAKNVADGAEVYERRADWLDRQVSKAVVGQTGTTDTKQGGLGDGGNKVHAEVREDIETADCKTLAAVLNRDLIRPWMDLEFGPSPNRRYPRLVIARPKAEDLKQLTDSLKELVPLGLRVEQSEIRDKFGLSEPAKDAAVLTAPSAITSPTLARMSLPSPPLRIAQQSVQEREPEFPPDQLAAAMAEAASPQIAAMVETIETMLSAASDLGEFRLMLASAWSDASARKLATIIAAGLTSSNLAGQSDLIEESAA